MTDATRPLPSNRDAELHRVADRLTVLCGFGELLRDGVYGFVTPEQHRLLEAMTEEAREAAVLYQELLRKLGRNPPT